MTISRRNMIFGSLTIPLIGILPKDFLKHEQNCEDFWVEIPDEVIEQCRADMKAMKDNPTKTLVLPRLTDANFFCKTRKNK